MYILDSFFNEDLFNCTTICGTSCIYKFKFYYVLWIIFQLSVSAKLPSGNDYSLKLDLAHQIIAEQCSYKILPSKIEIKLKKRNGIRWNTLEENLVEQNVQPISCGKLQILYILCYFIAGTRTRLKFQFSYGSTKYLRLLITRYGNSLTRNSWLMTSKVRKYMPKILVYYF